MMAAGSIRAAPEPRRDPVPIRPMIAKTVSKAQRPLFKRKDRN